METWAYTNGVKLDLIRPGKPVENVYIESFARVARTRLRRDDRLLDVLDRTIEMAEMLAPYSVYGMEEYLPPYDSEVFGCLNGQIKSTCIATGERTYGRYEFTQFLEHNGAEFWQPDIHWCGGLTEIRKIAALAAAEERLIACTSLWRQNAPWAELFMPPPGGPPEVYRRWEEDNYITRGPEGVYTVSVGRAGPWLEF